MQVVFWIIGIIAFIIVAINLYRLGETYYSLFLAQHEDDDGQED